MKYFYFFLKIEGEKRRIWKYILCYLYLFTSGEVNHFAFKGYELCFEWIGWKYN